MNNFQVTYKPFGDTGVIIEWPNKMNDAILDDVIRINTKLQAKLPKYIVEIIQSINSLTVIYHPELIEVNELILSLKEIRSDTAQITTKASKHLWKIPVCYDLHFGLDLEEIAIVKKLSIEQIIHLHTNSIYRIYSIGFLPGFLYLGGLDERLFIDRKANPRLQIMKGAVGIGGKQTGIYPSTSHGGWQIIGNSPISFFDKAVLPPCFAKPGDHIQFYSISQHVYQQIEKAIADGLFTLEKEVMHD